MAFTYTIILTGSLCLVISWAFCLFLIFLPLPSPSPYILLQLISTSLASLTITYDWDFQTSSPDHFFELYTNIHNCFLDIFMWHVQTQSMTFPPRHASPFFHLTKRHTKTITWGSSLGLFFSYPWHHHQIPMILPPTYFWNFFPPPLLTTWSEWPPSLAWTNTAPSSLSPSFYSCPSKIYFPCSTQSELAVIDTWS